ncbi:MAG: LuxR C-terminal-related transcriptional regulator [Nocardiopsaceae bacterium]|jgi:DNA-binding NarL/FixJ family response regulator|nr:LuxR C-terminal-related transcriptional regulator [Nocardiopsaceae bacterium]
MEVVPASVTVRVAVQSSHRLLRDALGALLAAQPDITVVGKVAEADGIATLCQLRPPDAVIVDAGRRLAQVAAWVNGLMQRFPELDVIVIYRDASKQDLAAACRAGVASLIPESHGLGAVLAMLQRRRQRNGWASRAGLTDREVELVVLMGSGHSVPEIAELLGISPFTVQNLKRRVYGKLDVSSSAHAVARAATLGMLDTPPPPEHAAPAAHSSRPVLTVVSATSGGALGEVVRAVVTDKVPFVLERTLPPAAAAHWEPWNPGPAALALVDPGARELDVAAAHGVPVILVHSQPLGTAELAEALASGVDAFVAAEQAREQFVTVLRMATQGYLVADSTRMRPIIRAIRARNSHWQDLPEVTVRERDILRCIAGGKSIRQTARALGIAPKTVENVQTGLFRKLGVHNRPGALAVAEGLGLVPAAAKSLDSPAAIPPRGFASPGDSSPWPDRDHFSVVPQG